MEESLDSLAEIVQNAPKNCIGWRPTSDIHADIYPHVRDAHLEYIQRLTKIAEDLQDKIKVS